MALGICGIAGQLRLRYFGFLVWSESVLFLIFFKEGVVSEEVIFIPYDEARRLVGNVIEEEHLHESNRRILTAYDQQGRELCWFDAEEVLLEVGGRPKKKATDHESEEVKLAAVEYVLHRIPNWVLQDRD